MKIKIVADSSCEAPESLLKMAEFVNVPLIMTVGNKNFVDDQTLDVEGFIDYMNASEHGAKSGCPSPAAFEEEYKSDKPVFAVTLSSELSGTYQNALSAASDGVEVIDSMSASAGEVLVSYKIAELAESCDDPAKVAAGAREFANEMKTYFIIENLGNFIKNGRVSPILGKAAGILKLRMVMGSDGHGKITSYGRSRSMDGAVEKTVELVKQGREGKSGGRMVITHCRSLDVAQQIADASREVGRFDSVEIMPTRGLSSMYANVHGVIIAF